MNYSSLALFTVVGCLGTCVSLKGSCKRELAKLVAYHILGYVYRNVLSSVVNRDGVSYKLREYCRCTGPSLDDLLDYCMTNGTPIVIATTGYNDEQIAKIHKASEQIPVFFTWNMSIGINLLVQLAKKATAILGGQFDIEIVEKHHNQKIDAPSGTALMLANAINEELSGSMNYVYDRHSVRAKRQPNEIGIHAIRGGTIVGEHDIIFAGRDEVITLSHSAASKEVFAVGAVNAAVYLSGKPAGIYDMQDMM